MGIFRCVLVAAAIALVPDPLQGQAKTGIDIVAVSPDRAKVLLENDHVRVVEYSLQPGQRDQPHTHPAKVSYVKSGGTLRVHPDGAPPFTVADTAGHVVWGNVTPRHFVENTGTTPVSILLFEVRGVKGQAAPPVQDPAVVNPASISVKLDHESVRVMEAVLPPGFKEVQHTHPPYVMYIVGGGKVRLHSADGRWRDSEFKTGDVFFSDGITHWAENTGTSTIKVLLVEIRKRRATDE